MNAGANPFAQPAELWAFRVTVPAEAVPQVEEALEDIALAFSHFEPEEDAPWRLEFLLDGEPDEKLLCALVQKVAGESASDFEVARVEQKDWLGEIQKNFPPFTVGRFYVHGSHVKAPPPASRVPLHIDAGMAFGSGEHETTSGCLLAIDWLAKQRRFGNVLDMGCGSGILAVAAAKVFHAPALAVDIDPISARIAQENAEINRVARYVDALAGDGYQAAAVQRRAPYDLVLANILARPLVRMAPALARVLAPQGVAVLSGLLDWQEPMVLAAHRAQGLRLLRRIRRGRWLALLLAR